MCIFPGHIDNGFMSEHSVGVNGDRRRKQNGDHANDNHTGARKQANHDSR